MTVSAVLLAAGASSRFGEQKLLAPTDTRGTPLIKRVLKTWTKVSFNELFVVLGGGGNAIQKEIQDFSYAAAAEAAADIGKSGGPEPAVKGARSAPRSGLRPLTFGFGPPTVRVVENPRWSLGMFTSVKAGLAAVADGGRSTHVAVSPADLPFLREESLQRVLSAAAAVDARTLLVPTHAGRRGHPLLFSSSLIPRVLSWPDDRRLSELLGEPDLTVLHLEGFDDDILRDVDRREDLLRKDEVPGSAPVSSPSKKKDIPA